MKSRKRISALVLAAAMCVSLFGFGITASAEYTDLEEHWSAEAVEKWSAAGIIRGEDGRFRPDDNITRAELAALLDRLLVYSSVGEGQFPDVPAQAWYAESITKLHAAGVMNGDERGAMRPEDFVSREEAAVLMYRALDIPKAPEELRFKDAPEVSDWARSAVGSLVSNRYIQGYANEFRPAAYMTRAEVVTLIDRMVALVANKPETYSGSYEGIIVVVSDGVVLENLSAKGLLISPAVGSGTVVLNNADIDGNVTKLNQNTKIQSNNSAITGSQPGGSNGVVSRPMVSGGRGGGGGGGAAASNPTMYRVMFKTNGGTFGGANTLFVSVEKGGSLGSRVPSEPTRENFVFTGWYLDEACTQKWEAASAAVQRDMVVYAGWVEQIYYTITFETNGGSAVVSQRIFNGERAQSVTPERRGYRFEGWYVNADFSGEKYSFDTAVTSSMTLYAKWSSETGQEIVISLADGVTGGSMTANPAAAIAGETVTLTFVPDAGKRLAGKPQVQYNDAQLAEADIIAMPDGTFTFVVPKEVQGIITVVPRFVRVYGIVVQESEHGTTAADKVQAESGENVTLAVIADEGYEAEEVTVTGGVTVTKVNDTTYSFPMPEENVTVAVTFKKTAEPEPERYTVSKQTAENGSFEVDKTSAQKDETVTITVAPGEGYEVDSVTVTGGVAVTKVNDTTYTFTMPEENVTVAVTFKAIVISGIEKTVTLGADRYGYAVNTASGGDDKGYITMITKQNATDFTTFAKNSDIMRMGLLGFDLAKIKEDGGTIQSAKLILTPRNLKNANTIFVHSFDKHNWGPVTNGKQVFELYATGGVFTIPKKFAVMDNLVKDKATELDITAICQEHTGEKISFLFTADTSENANTELQWYSPLASAVAEEKRPQLVVTYVTTKPDAMYDITVQECENGSASVDKTQAKEGETVTITAIPNEGYEVDSVTVSKAEGTVAVKRNSDGIYTFTMPAENVTVAVAFKKTAEPVETETLELPLADNSFTQIGSSHVNVAKYTASSVALILGKDRPSIYLKVDLSQVPQNKRIVSASVKVTYKKYNEWDKGVVLLKDNTWTGTEVTYNNSKDMFLEGTSLVSPEQYGTGDSEDTKTFSLDSARIPGLVDAMNQALTGDKLISLAVHYDNNLGKGTKNGASDIWSKDCTEEANCPVVILEIADK